MTIIIKLFDFVKLAQEKYHLMQDGKTPPVEVGAEETKETDGLVLKTKQKLR